LPHIGSGFGDDDNPVEIDTELSSGEQTDARHADQGGPGCLRTGEQGEQQAGGSLTHHADDRPTSNTAARQHRGKGFGHR
jgi:hypothetical protein